METERVVKLAFEEEMEEAKQELQEQKESYVREGIEQTALNMLKETIDINIISRVTGLNIDQIKKIESK